MKLNFVEVAGPYSCPLVFEHVIAKICLVHRS